MKIQEITLYQSPIKLKNPFIISLDTFYDAENIIVRMVTDIGIIGYGECSPFAMINGEMMESAYIIGKKIAKKLINANPLNIENCIRLMETCIFGNSSIKSAFDIALHDINAQFGQIPLYKFLSDKNSKLLKTDYTVSLSNPEKMQADAIKIKEKGFEFIKVKLGGEPNEDIERIVKIREAIGNIIPLRIDANQAWSVDSAIYVLKALDDMNIQFCEEPIPRWNFMELGKVRHATHIKIMADECCCDLNDAKRLIDLQACDYFNVKLGKAGGIFNAIKILDLAESVNLKVQIGGFLESRLAFTAAAHVAMSNDVVEFCDFDTPLMLEEDPVIGGINYNKGNIYLPDSIGLEASFNVDFLSKLTQITIS